MACLVMDWDELLFTMICSGFLKNFGIADNLEFRCFSCDSSPLNAFDIAFSRSIPLSGSVLPFPVLSLPGIMRFAVISYSVFVECFLCDAATMT